MNVYYEGGRISCPLRLRLQQIRLSAQLFRHAVIVEPLGQQR